MDEIFSLADLFRVFKKRLLLIVLTGVVGVVTAGLVTFFLITPKYQSSSQLLVNREKNDSLNAQWNDVQADIQMINTYKTIIKGPAILDEVKNKLDTDATVEQLSRQIEILVEPNSQIFSIRVTDENPYEAAEITNVVSEVFQEKIGGIMSIENVKMISEAVPDTNQVSPIPTLNIGIGLVLGIMFGVAFSFLLEFLDKTVRDEQFIKDALGWTLLGSISEMNESELKGTLPSVSPQESVFETRTPRKRV